jgi:hypothetical protein
MISYKLPPCFMAVTSAEILPTSSVWLRTEVLMHNIKVYQPKDLPASACAALGLHASCRGAEAAALLPYAMATAALAEQSSWVAHFPDASVVFDWQNHKLAVFSVDVDSQSWRRQVIGRNYCTLGAYPVSAHRWLEPQIQQILSSRLQWNIYYLLRV